MIWHLLPTISAPMSFQMALDELLFERCQKQVAEPVLRFYVSSESWISAGYSFRDGAALSRSALVRKNPEIPVCRRITGGGCVLHGNDLIFALIVRYGNDTGMTQDDSRSRLGCCFAEVRKSYEKIHEGVKLGLQACGLAPELYRREDLTKGNDCFDFPVESDLSWKGKKIAGGAQKRSHGVLLHHESVSVPRGVERDALIRGIREGLEQASGARIEKADWDPELYFCAEKKALDPVRTSVLMPQPADLRT